MTPPPRAGLQDRLSLFLLALLPLLLLVFVAHTEARRLHAGTVLERTATELATVAQGPAGFAAGGLPLALYSGFEPAAAPLVASNAHVRGLALHGADGALLFGAGAPRAELSEAAGDAAVRAAAAALPAGFRLTAAGEDVWQVVRPLAGLYGTAGSVVATLDRAAIEGKVDRLAVRGIAAALALAALFAAAAGRIRRRGLPLALLFATFAGLTLLALGNLYATDLRTKAEANVESVAARVAPLAAYGLTPEDVSGLDALLADYAAGDPDLSGLVIVSDGRIVAAAGQAEGGDWAPQSRALNVSATAGAGLSVHAAVPLRAVGERLAASLDDFLTVLVACAFFAASLFGLARARAERRTAPAAGSAPEPLFWLAQFVFFLSVAGEHLSYSFLPPLLEAAAGSGMATSVLLTAYFAGFAAALVPAGYLADRGDPRRLIAVGGVLAAAGLASLMAQDFWALLGGRLLAGVGQGAVLIGIQTYLLDAGGREKRTRAASVIVFGFNGGMVAGTSLGGLTVRAIEPSGVFLAAAALVLVAAVVAWRGMPTLPGDAAAPPAEADDGLARRFRRVLRETVGLAGQADVLRTLLLVGWPAKAALTGVIVFALPLILHDRDLPAERIGQAMTLYALAVMAVSKLIAGRVDRHGRTVGVLALGTLIAAGGLGVFAVLAGAGQLADWQVLALAFGGVLLLGLGHGCVNAPVIAHVAGSRSAGRHGQARVTGTYRLMERVGHVAGPPAIGGAMALAGGAALAALALAGALAAALFVVLERRPPRGTPGAAPGAAAAVGGD